MSKLVQLTEAFLIDDLPISAKMEKIGKLR
jgi:hypothetical protein